MTKQSETSPKFFAHALLLITAATLLLEITYTRIFSVTMWYHFAFMAVSIAMFGMAFGAVVVYLKPSWFKKGEEARTLTWLSAAFGLSIALTFWLHLQIPFTPSFTVFGIFTVVASFLIVTFPFLISGVIVSLVLTRYAREVGRLYAYDLVGASLGCLLLWALIRSLSGPGMVLFAAALAGIGGLLFSWTIQKAKTKAVMLVLSLLFLAISVLQPHWRLFEIKWVKHAAGLPVSQKLENNPLVEVWNSHSVITVFRHVYEEAFGWGMSPAYRNTAKPKQLMLTIDGAAGTVITKYTGNANEIKHLRYDVTALAHHLRPESKALVIGTGGGRDILTALLFNAEQVTGVEINRDILKLINKDMGNFTGHLDEIEKVRFVNDEARSWIERSDERFDIIQASLIDSWAATSAGAFVLTENSLYTAEAWTEFLNHLTPEGILTMSRWWVRHQPGEMLRVASLAYAALKNLGAENPREHVLIATTDYDRDPDNPNGVGTILVSKSPLTKEDIATFENLCEQLQFKILLTPEKAAIEDFEKVLDAKKRASFIASYPLNITPATDDNPFFFNMLRFRDILKVDESMQWVTQFNVRAVTILLTLFILVILLSAIGLILPVVLHERKVTKSGEAPLPVSPLSRHSLYFAGIGMGFILIEIAQMQRLTLFLGHPVYSLVAVLFSLLLATGLGSYLAGRFVIKAGKAKRFAPKFLWGLAIFMLLFAIVLPLILKLFYAMPLPPRIVFAVFAMFSMGVPMGFAFPLGLHAADIELPRATPLLWAINGATSVIGSVFAMILSIAFGITLTCIVGAGFYVLAAIAISKNMKSLKSAA